MLQSHVSLHQQAEPKANILYISYNGIDEPLVYSQVLAYLEGLVALGYRFHLITFERADMDATWISTRQEQLRQQGVEWSPVLAHKGLGALSAGIDVLNGLRVTRPLLGSGVSFVHARSFVPALIARCLKALTGVKFLNDIRGFWVDEKVYKGSLRAGGIYFRIGKWLESWVLTGSDYIVSLTDAGRVELTRFSCFKDGKLPPAVTIPTCVDAGRFAFRPKPRPNINLLVVGYVGSMGADYLPEEVVRVFSRIKLHLPGAVLRIVSRSDQATIRAMLHEAGLPDSSYYVVSVKPERVPDEIACLDIALSFIRPGYAKIASCPTKLGEYLAVGVPVVCNSGIGDVDDIVLQNAVGTVLDGFSESEVNGLLATLPTMLDDPDLPTRCRSLALDYFSLEKGISRYDQVYTSLLRKQIVHD